MISAASETAKTARLATPLGYMNAWAEGETLLSLAFEEGKGEDGSGRVQGRKGDGAVRLVSSGAELLSPEDALFRRLVLELGEYFSGKRRAFDIPLSPRGTAFRERVWRGLLSIPYGETRSYREQAATLGNPRAVRASAAANGANPIAILVPCHRVLGSDGSLTGYSGGLDRKRFLLELERRGGSAGL